MLDGLSPQEKRELLRRLLKQRSAAATRFPMSMQQLGLWHAFQRDHESTAYNVFLPAKVKSVVNLDAMKGAIEWLARRHAALRTTFSAEEEGTFQTVHDELVPEFRVIDVPKRDDRMIRGLVHGQTQRPFDLTSGPLLRVACLKRAEDEMVIVATTHHIVVDFWSLVLMMSEIRMAYAALNEGCEPMADSATNNYHEFVAEQSNWLRTDGAERDWQYWNSELSGATPVLDWVTDYERPSAFTGSADTVTFGFPKTLLARVQETSTKTGTTPNAVIMAALQVMISRTTRQDSFLIGTPFSGRSHQKFQSTVGFFVNMLPIAADLSGTPSFLDLVRSVGDRLVSALEHERFPFSEIVRRIAPGRDASRTPLFQVSCTFEKSHLRQETGRAGFLMDSNQSYDDHGLIQETFYVPHPTCHHDIEFVFELAGDEIRGLVCFCSDLFRRETIEQMTENFSALIESLLQSPELPVHQIGWGSCVATPPRIESKKDSTLTEILQPAIRSADNAVAYRSDEGESTWKETYRRATAIAEKLIDLGIQKGDVVPVCAARHPDALIGILGVVLSGATFVPIDDDQPAVSLDQLQNDGNLKAVVVSSNSTWASGFASTVVIDESAESKASWNDFGRVSPNDVAYVIYTSGSTGIPKGVMVSHGAIANTLRWRNQAVPLSADDRVLMLLSHQFDAAMGIALTCHAQAASLHWPRGGVFRDPEQLIDQIIEEEITVLPAVPSLIRLVVQHPRFSSVTSLRQIWCGGETMPHDLPAIVRSARDSSALDIDLWNFYGPTEAAVEASAFLATEHRLGERVPIGSPIHQTLIHVLDDQLRPVPTTVPGQLAIEGDGLADGYLGDDEETNRRFVNPSWSDDSGNRIYLTGDVGRQTVDGRLEYLQRLDDQVKVRGYRIELQEIEQTLSRHPDVRGVACRVLHPETSSAQLVAFFVSADPTTPVDQLVGSLRRHATEHLPSYKCPSAFDPISRIPVGTSGKIMRQKLPSAVSQATTSSSLPPTTELERYLSSKWAEILNLQTVGVTENFFELGGSSLQAAVLTSTLSDDLGVQVPTAVLFDLADITKLSRRLVELYEPMMRERFGSESVDAARRSPLVDVESFHPLLSPLNPGADKTPIFMIHPPGGIVACYRDLANCIANDQPLWAIRSRGLHGDEALPETIPAMAEDYVKAIQSVQPDGPYLLGGWSLGGVVAYEVAQQLLSQSESIQKLILLDSTIPECSLDASDANKTKSVGLEYGIDLTLTQLVNLPVDNQLPFLFDHARRLGVLEDETPEPVIQKTINDLKRLFHHHTLIASEYQLQKLDAPILLVRPKDVPVEVVGAEDRGWRNWASDVEVKYIAGHHHSMVQHPQVEELARILEGLG